VVTGSSTDSTLNGQLRYPNNLDQSLNDTVTHKVHKYRTDYNNNPPNTVSFMPAIASTSGRLHSEFFRLLFLQAHRETDRFFASSGVLSDQSDRGFLLPLPPYGFLCPAQKKSWSDSCQGVSFTYYA
jgi:hypothetical protein